MVVNEVNGHLKVEKQKVVEDELRIGKPWKLPLTRLQIDELDKLVDYYSRIYGKKQ